MAEGNAIRVVLLAAAGEARNRLHAAIDATGAELALVADPLTADPAEVAAVHPQAVLVALEPAVEDALERFDALLSDPGIIVVFDEAEVAAQRIGWDAARWSRHLAAKLHRHDDVLPPGSETEADWQPAPGPLPSAQTDAQALDIAAIADQAQTLAPEVPRDDGLDALLQAWNRQAAAAAEAEGGVHAAGAGSAANTHDLDALVLDDEDAAGSGAAGLDASSAAPLPADEGADPDAVPPAGADRGRLALLADDDFLPAASPRAAAAAAAHDAQAQPDPFAQLASGLSLADPDSYGHGPLRGAVLVEGGLGGPDAVRQLLAEIPAGFPRPILVRLQLDGGRYDRLVKQMARASRLRVALATAGQVADAGTIYFMPPGIGLVCERSNLAFADAGDAAASPLQAMPASDSAVLFLSGSVAALVEEAMPHAASGLLVAGQSPDSCYDASASNAVIARGGASGAPAELAGRLVARWPS